MSDELPDTDNIHLCQTCHDTLTGKRQSQGVTGHHSTLAQYLKAVEVDKCWICLRLKDQLSEEQYAALRVHGTRWLDLGSDSSYLTWTLVSDDADPAFATTPPGSFDYHLLFADSIGQQLHALGLRAGLGIRTPTLYLFAQQTKYVDETKLQNLAGHSTGSLEAWSSARQWINRCQQTHDRCRRKAQALSAELPTRLLDVGHPDLDSEHVCLVSGGDLKAEYCTLSHCWGLEPFLTLTDEKIEQMKIAIPVSTLTKTFQHAINITRRMNIRYLWIDSLCIIQHQPDSVDWAVESLQVGRYYYNAFCNISATASSCGSQGLFRTRDLSASRHANYTLPASQERTPSLYALINLSSWDQNLTKTPLHRRAWVMQERFLSRRVLHFGHDQLAWECSQATVSEIYPFGMPDVMPLQLRLQYKRQHSMLAHQLDDGMPVTNDHEITTLRAWTGIKMFYSRCLLTYPRDKPIALQGVVDVLQTDLSDICIYGLWKRNLAKELLWHAEDHLYPPTARLYEQQRSYDLPSWSWLTSDRPLGLDDPLGRRQPLNDRMLLEIKSVAGLTYMPKAKSNRTVEPRTFQQQPGDKTLILQAKLIPAHLMLGSALVLIRLTESKKVILPRVYLDDLVDGLASLGDEVYVIIALARQYTVFDATKPDGQRHMLDCLLLQPVQDRPGRYVRIGMCIARDDDGDVADLLEARHIGHTVSSIKYDPETGKHTVTLV